MLTTLARLIKHLGDWTCFFCDKSNPDTASRCTHCHI